MKPILKFALFFVLALPGTAGYIAKFDSDSRIVFSSDFEGNDDLYLLSRSRLTRLTDDPSSDQWPVPNSQGDAIVFMSNRSGNFDVYLMDLKSKAIKRLTDDPRDEVSPSWSFDDKFVYYDLKIKNNTYRTMKLDLRTGQKSPLFPDSPFSCTIVAFQNKQGDEIFFTAKALLGWLVAKYNVPSGRYTELTKSGSCRPKVSPDGAKVAYVCFDDDGLGDVFMMNSDGGGKINLTSNRPQSYDYYPCFSPDGSMIVFSSSPKAMGKKGYQLYTLNLKTGEIKRIFSADGNNSCPYWF